MLKKDARKAMKNGRPIAHICFSEGEYLYMLEDKIYTEDGIDFTRKFSEPSIDFESGWRITEHSIPTRRPLPTRVAVFKTANIL